MATHNTIDVPCSDMNHPRTHQENDMAAGEEKKQTLPVPWTSEEIPWRKYRVDDRDQLLLLHNLSWEEKVVFILTCLNSFGLDDLTADFKRDPRFSKVPDSYWGLDPSINIISIKVAESDVPFPISIYGTVLARDQVDYRCVYLFKRDRDSPQLITSTDDTLTLTGPNRALARTDKMFFEYHLKIKSEGGVDQDFSKGLKERNAVGATDMRPRTSPFRSYLIAVPWGGDLVLSFFASGVKRKSVRLEHYDEEWTCKLGTYELQSSETNTKVLPACMRSPYLLEYRPRNKLISNSNDNAAAPHPGQRERISPTHTPPGCSQRNSALPPPPPSVYTSQRSLLEAGGLAKVKTTTRSSPLHAGKEAMAFVTSSMGENSF
ncbi:hypothetical protein PR202_ga24250 [Eleusine coracana subsp. coracana]|uniref:DUF6598 domain-containing protein n=1 Tax=Eleusine coracana subsp. coracana TaxID=191504 RepID=A0AAV5D8D4_ELECO|nr:hypothetical protein PR202_ga24250 [Eleusine coracana subsp. coracana]